jgi:hypothetical protein
MPFNIVQTGPYPFIPIQSIQTHPNLQKGKRSFKTITTHVTLKMDYSTECNIQLHQMDYFSLSVVRFNTEQYIRIATYVFNVN